ncbi:hypothetical protein CLAIMM_03883 [Cladophialophora immunda]|nr:hypothetical protein CLAIMM_03883 [Cladophialophora immunda]
MAKQQQISTYNFLIVVVVALGSVTFGFTVNVTGPVLGMPSFYEYFHLDVTQTSGVIGAIPACYCGGAIFGAILGAWASERFGRRRALFATCIAGILGGILLGAAQHVVMLLLGRSFSGICAGGFQVVVPIYQSEVSPASRRGHMVGQHGVMLGVGAASAIWIGLGCSFAQNQGLQWRLPLSLSGLPPLILAPTVMWLPESPRWLVSRDCHEQALRILERLHKVPGDSDNLLAREEHLQIRRQLEAEALNGVSIAKALRQPSIRRRLAIGTLTQVLLQCSGVLTIITYMVILFENIGLSGWVTICLLGVWNTWATIGNYTNARIVDRFGRKTLLLLGLTGAVCSVAFFTAMVAEFADGTNRVGQGFGVLSVFLYATFYGFCCDVTGYVYCAEIFPTYMRAFGMCLCIIGYFVPALLFSQVAPVAFSTIGWKFYLVFIIIPACGIPIIWKYFPETKGVTLEEIAELFGEKVEIDLTHMSVEQKRFFDEELKRSDLAITGKNPEVVEIENSREG